MELVPFERLFREAEQVPRYNVSPAETGGFQEYRKGITKGIRNKMGGCVGISYSYTLAFCALYLVL